MIEVYKDWVIAVDSRQYITGKRSGNEFLKL